MRGTSTGLVWLITEYERTPAGDRYAYSYPHHVLGRIIDSGVDRGSFHWYVPSIDDPAYVAAPGVSIPKGAP